MLIIYEMCFRSLSANIAKDIIANLYQTPPIYTIFAANVGENLLNEENISMLYSIFS